MDQAKNPASFTAFGLGLEAEPIRPGLYVVATPIGNLRDISFRALATLAAADAVIAEDTRVTGKLLECFALNQRVAGHAVSTVHGGFTTVPDHMPASHRAHLEWTPAKLIAWGQRIGVSTAAAELVPVAPAG